MELAYLFAGAVLMLIGVGAGVLVSEWSRGGLREAWAPRQRKARRTARPAGPIVSTEALTDDDGPMTLMPPPAQEPPREERARQGTYEADMAASSSFYELQRQLRMQAEWGSNAGMLEANS